MPSARVEIPEGNYLPVRVATAKRSQQQLHSHFGLSVGAERMENISLCTVILIPVDPCSGGENKMFTIVLLHHLKQVDCPSNIVLKVHNRFFH